MVPPSVHDLTVLVAACYTVRCAVEVNRQLAQIERPLVAGPYVLQHVHQRFVCLRSPSAMVFLFQGSEASTIHGNRPSEQTLLDWQCNLDVALVPARDISDGRLHSGFSRCFREAVADVDMLISAVAGATGVWLSGHSLGGALAQICGLHIARHHPEIAKRTSIYTMGSPRVGDSAAARELAAGIPFISHACMPLDPIMRTPPLILGYAKNAGLHHTIGDRPEHRQGLLHSLFNTARGLWEHRICAYQRALEDGDEVVEKK